MLIIRLRRTGKKNKPSYRVVVAEHSFPVNGRFTADLGFYNPHTKAAGLKTDEAVQWMNKGARPSNTVAKIFKNEKIKHNLVVIEKKNKKAKSEKEAKPAEAKQSAAVEVQNVDAADEAVTEEASPTEETAPTPSTDKETPVVEDETTVPTDETAA